MFYDADRQCYIDTDTGDIIPLAEDDDVPHKPRVDASSYPNINSNLSHHHGLGGGMMQQEVRAQFGSKYNNNNNAAAYPPSADYSNDYQGNNNPFHVANDSFAYYDNGIGRGSNHGVYADVNMVHPELEGGGGDDEIYHAQQVYVHDPLAGQEQEQSEKDWWYARTLQMMEFEIANSAFNGQPEETATEREFRDKEGNASKCKKQLLTISTAICLAQIIILVVMIQTGGYASRAENPMIGPPATTMVEYGAKVKYLIVEENEWWRLITPIFLHAGIIHLISNVLIQLRVGGYLNTVYGNLNFCLIYFLSGIYGNVLSCAFLPQSIAVGSSGSVLGMLSSWLVWILFRWNKVPAVYHSQRNCQLGVVFVSIAITLGMSFGAYIDWAAHFGGAIMGILLAIVLLSHELTWEYMKHFRMFSACLIVAAYIAGLYLIFYGPSQNVQVDA